MNCLKDTTAYAFLIGFYETLRYGSDSGRTHESNQDWNEAYDKGMNLAEKLKRL